MKTQKEIIELLNNVDFHTGKSRYPSMTYEESVEETLMWVLGKIPDDEFILPLMDINSRK